MTRQPRADRILEAVAFAAQRMLLTPDWREVVDEVLRHLGEAAGASRAWLFENGRDDLGRLSASQRAEWVAPGIEGQLTNPRLQESPWVESGFGRWVDVLSGGDVVQGIVADMPADERPELEAQGIKSVLTIPVLVGAEWWGTIGFDDCERERTWSTAEIEALRAAAGTLGAAIHRERAETQLREAEDRYRSIVERTPVATYQELTTPPETTASITYVSPQIERMLGYPASSWSTIPGFWVQILHPEDRDGVVAESERTERTGEPFSREYRMIASDGAVVWIQDDAILVRDEAGQPKIWQGVMADITARKETEARLLEAEARYRSLVERLPAVVYIEAIPARPGAGDLYMSPRVVEIFGYTPEEWRWTRGFWIARIHPEDRERIRVANDRVNATHEPFAEEYRFRRKDGRYVWVLDEAFVVRDESGSPRYWQGFLMDVTERKQGELQLREAEQRFRTLVEQNPAIVYTQIIDEQDPTTSKTIYISPRHDQVFGYTAEESLANPTLWRDMIHPDDREAVFAADAATNESGDEFHMEYRMIAKDGSVLWIEDGATLVRDEAGKPMFWQGYLLDVTDRKDAEERLAQALEMEREATRQLRALDEMKNTFLQAVSHDLRTPLAAILGLAVTLERADLQLPPEDIRDLAARVAVNARKLDRLVTDLLDLDRLSRGIVEPKLYPTDVGALARRVVSDSDLSADGRVRVDAADLVVEVDAPKVERIIENLLANTIRHTPPGTSVWVRVEGRDAGVLISVEDDGPGIPPAEREAIFEPFRQGPGASSHSPGVGVGLALVARFAELHGGRAWVEGREGGGAAFRVFLPGRSEAQPAEAQPATVG